MIILHLLTIGDCWAWSFIFTAACVSVHTVGLCVLGTVGAGKLCKVENFMELIIPALGCKRPSVALQDVL